MDLMSALNRQNGQTFVIVTHDVNIARRTFRIVNMLDGEIIDETATDRQRQPEGAAAR
jgi:predicted ABC-type transport system involved in lysophospholipase L1 biosynthesis ATPase subunit